MSFEVVCEPPVRPFPGESEVFIYHLAYHIAPRRAEDIQYTVKAARDRAIKPNKEAGKMPKPKIRTKMTMPAARAKGSMDGAGVALSSGFMNTTTMTLK